MPDAPVPPIRIAAALIDDGAGRLLLVRKAGTRWFMQAGGKIESGEAPVDALCRELREEIGAHVRPEHARHLGTFTAPAANEPGRLVVAEVFHVTMSMPVIAAAEIEEVAWVRAAEARTLPLAPLTRDHVLPLAISLSNG